MRKSGLLKIASFILTAVIITSCGGIKKMVKNYDQVTYTVTPTVLEMHGDSVEVNISGKFPPKYFAKKVVAEATPTLKFEGGEKAYKMTKLQGEAVQDNNKVISYVDGGSFSFNGKIGFEDAMRLSKLEIKIDAYLAKKPEKKTTFSAKQIATGVIATPSLVNLKGRTILGKDNFQRITSANKGAELLYQIQQANIKPAELKKEQIKDLVAFIDEVKNNKRKEFIGVSVSSYASPDGTMELNSKLSEKRKGTADKYVENQLKKVANAKNEGFVTSTTTAEDWDGFKTVLEGSQIADKDLILRVLSMYSDGDQREKEIKNIAAAYTELAKDILPQLRRSKINVNINLIGYSDTELDSIFNVSPDSLKEEEMLYTATLKQDNDFKLKVYTKFAEKFAKDWRGENNKGTILWAQDKFAEAKQAFEAAKAIDNSNPIILNNLGACELKEGNIEKAKELLKSASGAGAEVNHNLGVIAIKEGDYAGAVSYFGDECSMCAGLAKTLNGDNDGGINAVNCGACKETAMGYYLKAVIGARKADSDALFTNLRSAIEKKAELKKLALTDMEFAKFFENDTFKSIVK